jgi:hypothetical protein
LPRYTSPFSIAVGVLAALVAFAGSSAQAKTKTKSHYYASAIESAPVSTGSGYPGVGGTAVLVGTWTTLRFGNGALVDYVTVTGHPTPATFTFKGTEIAYVSRGTFTDTFTGTVTVQSNGSQNVVTRGRVISGTGAYRGVTGRFRFTGATAPGSSVLSGQSAGTLSY